MGMVKWTDPLLDDVEAGTYRTSMITSSDSKITNATRIVH